MGWRDRVAALLGVSAYTAPAPGSGGSALDDPNIVAIREAMGGQLQPFPTTQTRWFLSDLEAAQRDADGGDLSLVGRLYRWMRTDGIFAGHLSSRCSKAVRLPQRFTGDPEMVQALTGRNGARSVFDDMFPAAELERLADDGLIIGVGVAELVPVQGRDYPVMVRLDPEFLRYRWAENRWYYHSIAGALPITPGDGRWILHTPGGRMAPWQAGLWPSCGRAAINKAHAELNISNWEFKWANPARAAVSPAGATDGQRLGFFQRLLAWGLDNVFDLPPGWDVKLIESNGRGHESPERTIERSERTYAIAICGQEVTTNGGKGFGNADVPERVLTTLIDATADAIAYTLNTQGIPPWVANRYGEAALAVMPILGLATKPPKDLSAQAQTLVTVATGIKALREELAQYQRSLNIAEICTEFRIPIEGDVDGDGNPDAAAGGEVPVDVANDTAEIAEPTPDAAAALAAKMTEHGVERCAHGSLNRCRFCGVERVHDFEPGAAGEAHAWQVAWRPIAKEAA